jgi:hypothetical protein
MVTFINQLYLSFLFIFDTWDKLTLGIIQSNLNDKVCYFIKWFIFHFKLTTPQKIYEYVMSYKPLYSE